MFKNHFSIKYMDFTLLICTIISSIAGLFAIFSATTSFDSNLRYIVVQGVGALIGIIALFVISWMDYNDFEQFKFVFMGIAVVLLGLVLIIGFGREDTGTQGWISLGPINVQPAELAKLCFIVSLGAHISKAGEDINTLRHIVLLFLHLTLYVGLVILQPDYGTAMVFVFIFIVMTYIGGLNSKIFLSGIGLIVAVCPLLWFFVLRDFQKKRIISFLNPESDPLGSGYHAIQSKIATGSGGLFGKGYLSGSQTQMGYLPEKQTDFIFSVISEEFGFIGAIIVTALLVTVIVRCFICATHAPNFFGELICIGVGSMLLFHTIENIGMCIGLLPITGIPLPFISYGGSSVLTNFISIGLVESVACSKRPVNY